MGSLKIAIACYPTYGGSGVVATEVGMELARRGHRVHVLSYDLPRRLDKFLENIFYHEVKVLAYPLFDYPPYCLSLASSMTRICEQEGIDLIHVHYAIPHAISAFLAKEVLGTRSPKVVTTLHGTDITLVGSDPSYLPITKLSLERSDGVTAVSEFLKQATYRQLEVPSELGIQVIPNFIDLNVFRCNRDRVAEIRSRLCQKLVADDLKLICHISNFRPLKRVSDVVRIFALVKKRLAAKLVLVGDGPDRPLVENLAQELGIGQDVIFLGKQSSVAEILSCSDLFLLPSETESFGLGALEAMACGVPVIATEVGGLPEVVINGKTGFLCPIGAVDDMAQKAIEILSSSELATSLGCAARKRVEQQFQIGPVVDRYEEYYKKVLAL